MFVSSSSPRLASSIVKHSSRGVLDTLKRRSLSYESSTIGATRTALPRKSVRTVSSSSYEAASLLHSSRPAVDSGSIEKLKAAYDALKLVSRLQNDRDIEFFLEIHRESLTDVPKNKVQVFVGQLDHSLEAKKAYDLVTLLLDDPLSSDSKLRVSIHKRDENSHNRGYVCFEHPDSYTPGSSNISLPSPFLTRFKEGLILEESYASEFLSRNLLADVPIFIVSPLLPPPGSSLPKLINPHALLVVDGSFDTSSPSTDKFREYAAKVYGFDLSRVFFVDISRALRGIQTLTTESSSANVVRAYQEDLLASGFTTLSQSLNSTISLGARHLHGDTLRSLLEHTLKFCESRLHAAKLEVLDVKAKAGTLHENALEEKERATLEILRGNSFSSLSDDQNRITFGIDRTAAEIKSLLDNLTFWRLPFVIDEISTRVDSTVDRAFAKEFENDLIFNTGKLSSLQSQLINQSNTLLASLPPPFQSFVLRNSLDQLKSSPSLPLTASSPLPSSPHVASSLPPPALLAPIRSRLTQLSYATRALHLSAQRALLTSFLSSAFSASGGAAFVTFETLDAAGGAAFGALGALIGIRWAVGSWVRARASWWSAFKRVGEGLGRDMQDSLEDVMQKQVCLIPEETCRGIKRLAEKRELEIEEAQDIVENLSKDISEKSVEDK